MAWASPFQLRIIKGNQQGLVIPLIEQVYILGRATSQGETAPGYMFFYEPTVSRVHAELRWNEKKKSYFVHHQSKTNPTLVEGVPVDKKTPRQLEKGQKIQMGYLVLELEPLSPTNKGPELRPPASSGASPRTGEAGKTHKMMVGNILEALSNLNQEKVQTTSRLQEARAQPRQAEPEPPTPPPASNYLERDYGASETEEREIQFSVAQGPDQGQVFVLREQVGVFGRLMGRDDPRRGQGVLLSDDSLPQEAAYLVWQNRDRAFGLSESDGAGVAIRIRRVQNGQPMEFSVGTGPPVLLRDGDVVQLGRSSLVVRTKGSVPAQPWTPQETRVGPPAWRPGPPAAPVVPAEAPPTSRWERPEPPPSVRSISLGPSEPSPPPALSGGGTTTGGGGIVPRNFPGTSGALHLDARSRPEEPARPAESLFRPEPEAPTPLEEAPTTFRLPQPPSPPEPTLLGRSPGSGGLSGLRSTPPTPPPVPPAATPPPAPAAPAAPLDPSTAPTLGTAPSPPKVAGPLAGQEDRSLDMQPLSWPWRDNSDFVFDFVSGPNRGRQIALNANELQDDRVITLGSGPEHVEIPLDGTNYLATLRHRSRRFALLNQGPDDSVLVNRVPLKRGDQVVLMTGDRIDIGETCFRFLERGVVEVLQGFQVVVESGVDQDQDKVFPFSKQRLLIGRGKNCDVRLTDLEVSRIHIALVHRDGKFFVQHRSETNPTFLNGMSLLQGGERLIQPGDRVRLSSLTLLQFTKVEPRKRSHAPGPAR